MDSEYIHIQMVDHIKDNGLMENNMVKAHLSRHKVLKDKAFGKKVKESNGTMKKWIQISNLRRFNEIR